MLKYSLSFSPHPSMKKHHGISERENNFENYQVLHKSIQTLEIKIILRSVNLHEMIISNKNHMI